MWVLISVMEVQILAVCFLPVAAFLVYLVKKYFDGGVCTSTRRMDGKTVIITGANCGIGKETAVDLAKRGARVIMACRDERRGQEAVREVIQRSKNTAVYLKLLDLASLSSTRAFAADILEKEDRLDVLINNAGIGWDPFKPRPITEDGFEEVLAVNLLGHFLLTNLLLDLLKKSAPSRVINVSSSAYKHIKGINFTDIHGSMNYSRLKAYHQSKLANILFARELSHRMKGTGVTAYSLHPGVVRTEIWRYFPWLKVLRVLFFPVICFMKSSQQGAQTTIHLAVSDVEEFNGMYFADCVPEKLLNYAEDDGAAKKLWEVSAEMVGL